MIRGILALLAILALLRFPLPAQADTFTVRQDDGSIVTVDARLAGEGQGVLALERTDGRIELVPQGLILERKVGPDPEPISCEKMVERLTEEFGKEKFRAIADKQYEPYVVGIVLAEPLDKKFESNAKKSLKDAADFMKKIDGNFVSFLKELKVDYESPRYPLVLLIFETDSEFVRYTKEHSGSRGLAAESMLGFYSGLTNRLIVRMSECATFATPLHEAIHQQVYNRGVFRRLAPIPTWFNEGIATSFEGDGTKVKSGPMKINTRYAELALSSKNVDWDQVVADDKAFHGDVFVSEAYAHAWSIHWFLVSKYRKKYVEYLELLGQKQPLQIDSSENRTKDFEKVFGKRVGQLQGDFPTWLEQKAKQQHIALDDHRRVGRLLMHTNLAEVDMVAAQVAGGTLEADGKMRNVSKIRPMSFYITIETDGGYYAEWYLPKVACNQKITLERKTVDKQMKDSPGRDSNTFHIKVKSEFPDSETGRAWQRGERPTPTFHKS